ncbi:MAG: phosphoserine phosphatase SerB [Pseudomonadota bacterium]
MFIATMIASREGGLDSGLIEEIAFVLASTDRNWLSEGRVIELRFPSAVDIPENLRAALAEAKVDFALQPDGDRRKKLLIADMDSTLIEQECIDELARAAGVGAQVVEITERAMRGEIDFSGALTARVALLRDQPASLIDEVLANQITRVPGGAALVATMRAAGAYTALVSGGFTQFAERVAATLGFHEYRANSLQIANDQITGEVNEPILGRDAKVVALNELCAKLGIRAKEALTVGDGANDIGMLHGAGLGVAMHAKPAVRKAADVVVDHADLTALLYLQGYREAEIIRPTISDWAGSNRTG